MVAGIAQSTLMRRFFVKVAVIGVALWTAAAVTSVTAREKEPIAAGLWEKVDASGKPEAWFQISECGGVYEGQIVKIFPKPGEDPSQWRCTKCEGEQKNAPVLGITFIRGMRRNGLAYENGTILDPRDGSVYNARMELSPDGNQLTVRGYLGISLLGQSQVWRRLPDNALEPSKTGSCAHDARSQRGQDRSSDIRGSRAFSREARRPHARAAILTATFRN
jgi:uncharacterized protein (DUF2147 family)